MGSVQKAGEIITMHKYDTVRGMIRIHCVSAGSGFVVRCSELFPVQWRETDFVSDCTGLRGLTQKLDGRWEGWRNGSF